MTTQDIETTSTFDPDMDLVQSPSRKQSWADTKLAKAVFAGSILLGLFAGVTGGTEAHERLGAVEAPSCENGFKVIDKHPSHYNSIAEFRAAEPQQEARWNEGYRETSKPCITDVAPSQSATSSPS